MSLVAVVDVSHEELGLAPTIRSGTAEERKVYRIRHPREAKLLSPNVTELGGLMLEVKSNRELGWTLRLQIPDRRALSDLWEFCEREGISFGVNGRNRPSRTVPFRTQTARHDFATALRFGRFVP